MGVSLSTLPNILIMGIPLLKLVYGEEVGVLFAQIVELQSLIWYNLLLFLLELSAAREVASADTELSTARKVASTATKEAEAGQAARGTDEIPETNTRIPRTTKIKVVLLTMGKKLVTNLNFNATVAGFAWAFISFVCNVKLPKAVEDSISILLDGGLGMAMFSLGLFMASQTHIVACGTRLTLLAMVLWFVVGPAMMAGTSFVVGLNGAPFQIAILQVALPQGLVPFVFAKEYNVHPEILNTAIIVRFLVALPVALVYYLLLRL